MKLSVIVTKVKLLPASVLTQVRIFGRDWKWLKKNRLGFNSLMAAFYVSDQLTTTRACGKKRSMH